MPRVSIFDEMNKRGGCGDGPVTGGMRKIMGGGIEVGVALIMLVVLIAACYWFYKCCWKKDDSPAPAPAPAKFGSYR